MITHWDDGAKKMVEKELGITIAQPFTGHVIYKAGEPVGAFVINGFDRIDCNLTAVGKGAFSVPVVRQIARYVFGQLGCARCSARTRMSNKRAIDGLFKAGFVWEGVQRQGFGDEDAARFGLLKSEQRIVRL